MIEVRDGSENVLQHMIYGTQYVDEPVALVSNPGVSESWYFHHADANYNVVMLTDENGLEAECYQYTPYGQTTTFDGNFYPISSSAMANPACYTGRQLDPETGLYYYRARHYQPSLGRFLQRDPLEYIDGLNLYRYVSSSPTNTTDPTGTFGIVIDLQASYVCNPCENRPSSKSCAEKEGMPVEEWCDWKDRWQDLEPPVPITSFPCMFLAGKKAQQRLRRIRRIFGRPLDDKFMHCYAGCEIAKECGRQEGIYAGWYDEWDDLTDCRSDSGFDPEDYVATAGGADNVGPNTSCFFHCIGLGYRP